MAAVKYHAQDNLQPKGIILACNCSGIRLHSGSEEWRQMADTMVGAESRGTTSSATNRKQGESKFEVGQGYKSPKSISSDVILPGRLPHLPRQRHQLKPSVHTPEPRGEHLSANHHTARLSSRLEDSVLPSPLLTFLTPKVRQCLPTSC